MKNFLVAIFLVLLCSNLNAAKIQFSAYGDFYSEPFEEMAVFDCRLNCGVWPVITPYFAFTKYTTFSDVSPIFGLGLNKTFTFNRTFLDCSAVLYNDKSIRLIVFTTFDIIK